VFMRGVLDKTESDVLLKYPPRLHPPRGATPGCALRACQQNPVAAELALIFLLQALHQQV